MDTQLQKNGQAYFQLLFGWGSVGGASHREAASHRILLSPVLPRRVAAALSAAVTSTKSIGDEPHSHGRSTPKERTSLFPATLRERGSGGEALLLEKRPLPQRLPPSSLGEGARGRGLLFREVPSLAKLSSISFYNFCCNVGDFGGGGGVVDTVDELAGERATQRRGVHVYGSNLPGYRRVFRAVVKAS